MIMTNSEQNIDRRTFLSKSAAAIAGGSALANTALSYGRILGANDRISLCHVGNGGRGGDLDLIVSKLASSHNAEMNAVCDLWRLYVGKRGAGNTKKLNHASPRIRHTLHEIAEQY